MVGQTRPGSIPPGGIPHQQQEGSIERPLTSGGGRISPAGNAPKPASHRPTSLTYDNPQASELATTNYPTPTDSNQPYPPLQQTQAGYQSPAPPPSRDYPYPYTFPDPTTNTTTPAYPPLKPQQESGAYAPYSSHHQPYPSPGSPPPRHPARNSTGAHPSGGGGSVGGGASQEGRQYQPYSVGPSAGAATAAATIPSSQNPNDYYYQRPTTAPGANEMFLPGERI